MTDPDIQHYENYWLMLKASSIASLILFLWYGPDSLFLSFFLFVIPASFVDSSRYREGYAKTKGFSSYSALMEEESKDIEASNKGYSSYSEMIKVEKKKENEKKAIKEGYTSYQEYLSATIKDNAERKKKERLKQKEEDDARQREEEIQKKMEMAEKRKLAAKKAARTRKRNERDKIAKERKEEAFKKDNFQSGHSRIGMNQRDKVWNGMQGVCGKCLDRELEKNPEPKRPPLAVSVTSKTYEQWRKDVDEYIETNVFNAYTEEVSFFWTIHPKLEVVLRCNKCAVEDGLIEMQTKDEKRSRHISEDVRNRVWKRDNGECRECGSRENIEFDHIIPHSKGGSNTYRNIQLLCEQCNRSKSDTIG